jgi:N-acetylmuramoyl-L-alanine amidase
MNVNPRHFLDAAIPVSLPGGAPMAVRRCAVIHYTAGWSAQSSIAYWRTSAAKGASAHLVIDRDGTIYQCRPFNRTAGHAGMSAWTDPKTGIKYRGLNSCSIGIELANRGSLGESVYPVDMPGAKKGEAIPHMRKRHKNDGRHIPRWELYPKIQTDVLKDVLTALFARYKLDDIVGHDDIAPQRKTDPGPAFPMEYLRHHFGLTI